MNARPDVGTVWQHKTTGSKVQIERADNQTVRWIGLPLGRKDRWAGGGPVRFFESTWEPVSGQTRLSL